MPDFDYPTQSPLNEPDRMQAILADIQRYLDDKRDLMLALQNDPDEVTINQALVVLRQIRDGQEKGEMLQRRTRDLRDLLVANLVKAVPTLNLKVIADAAGFKSDSYVTRVARRLGAKPRTERRRKARRVS